MNKLVIIRLALAGLMIALGAAIYIVSRENIIFFDWLPESIMRISRFMTIEDNSKLGYFVKYCLPDGLWYCALLTFQGAFMDKSLISKALYWICVLLPFAWEIAQLHHSVRGTFDPMDLMVYLIVFLLFTLTRLFSKLKL